MSKIKSLLVALTAVVSVGVASAQAGGPRSIKDDPAGGILWSGFYVGIQGGYGWGDTRHVFTAPPGLDVGSWDIGGALAGVTVGANWQTGRWVYGIEGDFSFADIDGAVSRNGCNPGFNVCYTEIQNLGTVRLRLGYALDNKLLYATGGLAYGSVDAGINFSNQNDEKMRWGWVLGAGLEWAFAPRWSLKAEYLHVDLGDRHHYDAGANDPGNVDVTADIVRVGLSYSFGPSVLGGR